MTYPVFTAGDVLGAADMNAVGLWLVKTVTIGAGAASVPVADAFSSNYDDYQIIVTGGVASGTCVLQLSLGSTLGGYYYGADARTYGGVTLNVQAANTSSWYAGEGTVNSLELNATLKQPFTAKNTTITSVFANTRTDGYWLSVGGYLADTTSYTGFTITPSGGATLTGGTIRVYGYRK
jgi:hypothetical protein